MTSEASSSNSRERDLVKFNKGPLMLKTKQVKTDNTEEDKKVRTNLNEEIGKKCAEKLDLQNVSYRDNEYH
jgi:hypothetical protein